MLVREFCQGIPYSLYSLARRLAPLLNLPLSLKHARTAT